MYKLANAYRKAMQEKAKRLTTADPNQKVDSSTWTPAEPLNTEVKTGARPLVRRIYKSGGKVHGDMTKKRADRAARKSGGRTAPWVDDLINRDVRTANEAREGKKHVGAFASGGKAFPDLTGDGKITKADVLKGRGVLKKGGRSKHADGKKVPLPPVMPADIRAKRAAMAKVADMDSDKAMMAIKNAKAFATQDRDAMARAAAADEAQKAANRRQYEQLGMKKGGKAMPHEDVAEDKKLIKKMVKSSAMKDAKCYGGKAKKAGGGMLEASKKAMLVAADPHMKGAKKMTPEPVQKPEDQKKAKGGSVFLGNSTTKVPGVVGGRKAHKRGGKIKGKTKGKTNISINIMPQAGGAPIPPMGIKPPILPPISPPMVPPTGATLMGGTPMGGAPMGGAPTNSDLLAAFAGGMKGGAAPMPPAPMPMPRKSGGRTIHVINHASGGGLGRLEKIKAYGEAQKKLP